MPRVVDLAAMRAAMKRAGGDPQKINPLVPVDLVIDHSVQVDEFGTDARAAATTSRWSSSATASATSSSSGARRRSTISRSSRRRTGIVHQVNLEYLAKVVHDAGRRRVPRFARRHRQPHDDDQRPGRRRLGRRRDRGRGVHARPADLHGHAAGRRLQAARQAARRLDRDRPRADRSRRSSAATASSRSSSSSTATGLATMSVADRATIANMAPEYGATMGFFPVDEQTLAYLRLTGRDAGADRPRRALLQGAGPLAAAKKSSRSSREVLELDLGTVVPSVAGPRRPQDRVELRGVKQVFRSTLVDVFKKEVGESATPRLDRWSAEAPGRAAHAASPTTATRTRTSTRPPPSSTSRATSRRTAPSP